MPTPVRSLSRLNRTGFFGLRGAARPAQRAALAAQLHQFDILVRNDDGTVSVRWPYLKNRTVPVD